MTLEDARIIERYYLIEQHHHFPPREYRTRLSIIQILLALSTIDRHLPVPRYRTFDYYVWLGSQYERGADAWSELAAAMRTYARGE
jgi:hypothetical protein